MTNEEIAVAKFMERKGYEEYGGGCACSGAQIDVQNDKPYTIRVTSGCDTKTLSVIRAELKMTPTEILKFLKGEPITFGKQDYLAKYRFKKICDILTCANVVFEAVDTSPIYFPACSCRMNYFERVDNQWYEIFKVVESTKISFHARLHVL